MLRSLMFYTLVTPSVIRSCRPARRMIAVEPALGTVRVDVPESRNRRCRKQRTCCPEFSHFHSLPLMNARFKKLKSKGIQPFACCCVSREISSLSPTWVPE